MREAGVIIIVIAFVLSIMLLVISYARLLG